LREDERMLERSRRAAFAYLSMRRRLGHRPVRFRRAGIRWSIAAKDAGFGWSAARWESIFGSLIAGEELIADPEGVAPQPVMGGVIEAMTVGTTRCVAATEEHP
jgi:hypothetical protein